MNKMLDSHPRPKKAKPVSYQSKPKLGSLAERIRWRIDAGLGDDHIMKYVPCTLADIEDVRRG